MPLNLDALTQRDREKIFLWIAGYATENADDAFAAERGGKTYYLASAPFCDAKTGEPIGKYVLTIFFNTEEQVNEILDLDIVLNNDSPVTLHFDRRLPPSSAANEYYDVVTKDADQHLIVETVNRHTVADELEGTQRNVFASAFPFQFTVFESIEDYNRFCGFKKPVEVGDTGLTVHGLATTFACPSSVFGDGQGEEDSPWSFVAGEITSFREVSISFGTVQCDAFLVTVHSALGELPTLVGKEVFDTSRIQIGKIVGMSTCIKVDFVKDRYPKTGK